MADFYLKSGSATERINSTPYVAGDKIVIARADTSTNYAVVRKWVLECTTAGTTGAAVPAWPATVTQDTTTVVDGGVTWTFRKPGFSTGTTAAWAFSAIYMDYIATALASDTLYVSDAHAESTAAAITFSFAGTSASPVKVICGDDIAEPPTAVSIAGTVSTTSGGITITGSTYAYGLTFAAGVGATTVASISLGSANGNHQFFEKYIFHLAANNASTKITVGGQAAGVKSSVSWKNCDIKFNHASQSIELYKTVFRWDGGTLLAGGVSPTALFTSSEMMRGEISGVDFSNCASTVNLVGSTSSGGKLVFRNIKLPASWTGNIGTATAESSRIEMHNGDSADTNYKLWVEDYAGSVRDETTIVRTGGANDGTTALAWKMSSNANASYPLIALDTVEIAVWNDTAGAAKTCTLEIVHDSQGAGAAGAFTNEEIWVEAQYFGTVGFPLGSFTSNGKADVLAAAADQPSSTATWTTTGLTTPVKQKLAVTFTPQKKGFVYLTVHLAKASKTVYIDPKITVT